MQVTRDNSNYYQQQYYNNTLLRKSDTCLVAPSHYPGRRPSISNDTQSSCSEPLFCQQQRNRLTYFNINSSSLGEFTEQSKHDRITAWISTISDQETDIPNTIHC